MPQRKLPRLGYVIALSNDQDGLLVTCTDSQD